MASMLLLDFLNTNFMILSYGSVFILITILFFYRTRKYDEWDSQNLPYVRKIPFFGNYFKVAFGMEHILDMYQRVYDQLDGHKLGGFFQMRTPYLMMRDPETINRILTKDFEYFPDRGVYSDFSANPLSNNLFFMHGPKWRVIRNKLTPAFSSRRLKMMYDQIKECNKNLIQSFHKMVQKNDVINVKDIIGRYATDVVSICFLDLEVNTLADTNNLAFCDNAMGLFNSSLRFQLKEISWNISPVLLKIVKLLDFPTNTINFFSTVFNDTVSYREKHNIVRNDFMNSLMQARKDLVLNDSLPEEDKFMESQIVANAFNMYGAGFETISSAITFSLYEFAMNKHVQDKVRNEINSKIIKYNGEITYEMLMELDYLNMAMSEVIRYHGLVLALFRQAERTYKVPGDSFTIKKGQRLIIPIHSLNKDPKYFSDPEVFNPERFSVEEKSKRPNGIFLPFGAGQRICIAKRFAEIEIKSAIANILLNYEVEPCANTVQSIAYGKGSLLVIPKDNIWLRFKEIA